MGIKIRSQSIRGTDSASSKGDRGASLVEFAMVMPFLLVLLFGVIDFGWTLSQNMDLRSTANFGARAASVSEVSGSNADDRLADLVAQIQARASQLDEGSVEVAVAVENANGNGLLGDPGDDVVVCLRYPFESLTGLLSPFINGKSETLAVMRVEQDITYSTGTSSSPAWSGGACTSS